MHRRGSGAESWPVPDPPADRTEGPARPSMPRRRSWLPWLVLVAGLGALLAAGIAASSILGYARTQATAPGRALQQYCSDLLARNYAGAYALLDADAQHAQTRAQFVADAQLHDTIDGRAVSCVPGQGASGLAHDVGFLFSPPSYVELPATVRRARLGVSQGTVTLDQQGGGWHIQYMDAALQGTPLGPLHVAEHFCGALAAGDYASAFADLSAHQMAVERTPANFAAEAARPAGVGYAGCAPNYASYAVKGDAATLGLTLDLRVATPSGGATVPLPASTTFVLEHGAWKLDGLVITAPGSA